MELRITCEGSDLIDYKTIKNLQSGLKTRTNEDIEGMIKSLILHGFSFPMFVYKHKGVNYALDGHGRLLALSMLEETGYFLEDNELKSGSEPWIIPLVPCVYIEAKDFAEAKVKLLKHNSEYGTITQVGFNDFTKDIDISEYSGIPIKIVETSAIKETDSDIKIDDLLPDNIGEETQDTDGEQTINFEPSLDPKIDTSVVTYNDIEKV
jgi:hypothetical protein